MAPTSRLQYFWFYTLIMNKCDVMTCLHSAHTLAVAKPCDFDRFSLCHFVGHYRITRECMSKQHISLKSERYVRCSSVVSLKFELLSLVGYLVQR